MAIHVKVARARSPVRRVFLALLAVLAISAAVAMGVDLVLRLPLSTFEICREACFPDDKMLLGDRCACERGGEWVEIQVERKGASSATQAEMD